jgi:hypothetical protein
VQVRHCVIAEFLSECPNCGAHGVNTLLNLIDLIDLINLIDDDAIVPGKLQITLQDSHLADLAGL